MQNFAGSHVSMGMSGTYWWEAVLQGMLLCVFQHWLSSIQNCTFNDLCVMYTAEDSESTFYLGVLATQYNSTLAPYAAKGSQIIVRC